MIRVKKRFGMPWNAAAGVGYHLSAALSLDGDFEILLSMVGT